MQYFSFENWNWLLWIVAAKGGICTSITCRTSSIGQSRSGDYVFDVFVRKQRWTVGYGGADAATWHPSAQRWQYGHSEGAVCVRLFVWIAEGDRKLMWFLILSDVDRISAIEERCAFLHIGRRTDEQMQCSEPGNVWTTDKSRFSGCNSGDLKSLFR